MNSSTIVQIGDRGQVEKLPELIKVMKQGGSNEKRLAASAVKKLTISYGDKCLIAVPSLFYLLNDNGNQVRQYSLSALKELAKYSNYNDEQLKLLHRIKKGDVAEYNKRIAGEILNQIHDKKDFSNKSKIVRMEKRSVITKRNNSEIELFKGKGISYTEQQQNAVFHDKGPALVLAVPGSGKTTTIIGRIANLILKQNVNSINILAITFSRASALEMNKRFKSLFGQEIKQEVKFCTIHAFANTVICNYNRRFNKKLKLLKSWQINHIIQNIYEELFKELIVEDALESYITGISYVKNRMLTEQEINDYEEASELKLLNVIIDKYDKFKKDQNYYDYDDMLELCLKILRENRVTLEFLRNKYKYVLVDEGQDTSPLQYEIIKLLVAPKNNIYIVADDDQTIYKFRGANPETLLNIDEMFPNTKRYFMERNFRSTKPIIEIANKLIKNNKSRYEKKIFTKKDGNSSAVEVVYLDDIKSQNKYLINNIKSCTGNVGLLYRNNILAIPIANYLYKNGIEFSINNYKFNFFDHWVVKDIMSIIDLINNGSNVQALSNIYYKIKSYINRSRMNTLLNTNLAGQDVFQYMLNNFKLNEYEYDRILILKICFEEARKKKVNSCLRDILYEVNYMEYIENSNENISLYEELIDTTIEILQDVEEFSEANNSILKLKDIIEESSSKNNQKVILSTFHGSKGLEFTNVFLLNVTDYIIPSSPKEKLTGSELELEDDRRLFYVAITRAKENLKILVPGISSIFVDEILESNNKDNYVKVINKTSNDSSFHLRQDRDNFRYEKEADKYERTLATYGDIRVGSKIALREYSSFGKFCDELKYGEISEINDDKVKIEFLKESAKIYSIKTLIEKKYIYLIREINKNKYKLKDVLFLLKPSTRVLYQCPRGGSGDVRVYMSGIVKYINEDEVGIKLDTIERVNYYNLSELLNERRINLLKELDLQGREIN
ncbi:MAG: ATP-dependent helicase [Clostridium sp.]|nr:ATP-dependent helicase [Clostridium sp.]